MEFVRISRRCSTCREDAPQEARERAAGVRQRVIAPAVIAQAITRPALAAGQVSDWVPRER